MLLDVKATCMTDMLYFDYLKVQWSSGTHSFIITEPQKYDSKLITTV